MTIKHFINDIYVKDFIDVDFIRENPDPLSVFLPYVRGIGNDDQNSESPFFVFNDGIDEFFGMIIRKYQDILDVMRVGPVEFKYPVCGHPEQVQRNQIDEGEGKNEVVAEHS